MKILFTDIPNFLGNGHPSPKFRPRICQYLQDSYVLGQEYVVRDSNINNTLHYMTGDAAKAVVPHTIEVRH